MNRDKFRQILKQYYKDFEKNWREEDYKWLEVQQFQEKYEYACKTTDFTDMLKKAINSSSNLVASKNYYPFNEILKLSDGHPNEVKKAFQILLDEDRELYERIESYVSIIKKVKEISKSESKSDGIDMRFISTILYFAYPWKYTIYKYKENKEFCEKYETGIKIKAGFLDVIEKANLMTDLIINCLEVDGKDIINLYREKLQDSRYSRFYYDKNLKMLAQNILWYATAYQEEYNDEKVEVDGWLIPFHHGTLEKSHYIPRVSNTGNRTDYQRKAKENVQIGQLGEDVVIKFENARIKHMGKTASWESINKGDGLGYDILSYNEDGTKRYIEVKTTKGDEKSTFYITATELEACKKYGDDYYLYRVYQRAGEWEIVWYQGKEVEELCNCPYSYAVQFE